MNDQTKWGSTSNLDTAHFREVLGHFATGITVMTSIDDKGPMGLTCQAFMSLSLRPQLVAIGISIQSTTWPRMKAVGRFCVNVMNENQESLCRAFSVSGQNKFERVGWSSGECGLPLLIDSLAWIECSPQQVHDGGDHHLIVAKVESMGIKSGSPLVFYRGGYRTLES